MNATLIDVTPLSTMFFLFLILTFVCFMFMHNLIDALLISALVCGLLYLFPMYSCIVIAVGAAGFMFFSGLDLMQSPQENIGIAQAEFNSNGMLIGYRYVIKDEVGYMSVTKAGLSRNGGHWEDGYLESDRVPTMNNTSGIYAAKNPNSSILDDYRNQGYTLVKVELSGRVVEGEHGYRAQCCQIVEEL